MIQDYIDMDTHQKVRYVSESSNASTSGYSTMSTQLGNQSPISNVSNNTISMPPSPVTTLYATVATSALPAEFSQLNLPPSINLMNSSKNNYSQYMSKNQNQQTPNSDNYMYSANNMKTGVAYGNYSDIPQTSYTIHSPREQHYTAELRIIEHPVEKFRFRYKSEMHGTHGSLNGTNSKRTPKTFPEVELCNYYGNAMIRCSLFQANLNSPHSHQLVIRKDEQDICDPHDLNVAPDRGYSVQFQNMGIIHTAKKFIFDELFKKKLDRLRFSLGREELSTKELQELKNQTERESKDMNLNQVRLCFEAFQVTDDKIWTPIAAPVYTNPINNRKSAQTGELRICRLSIASGSVLGGDDLILLVEKVSKKNIKVRFFERNEDDEIIWEAFGKFREADVHHQYAILCQTPPYKDKHIETPVEIYIELIRPSDDERSFPPVTFRYKPRESIVSRKRRRTSSNATITNSLNSSELPKTLHDTTAAHLMPAPSNHNNYLNMQQYQQQQLAQNIFNIKQPTISEEFNKDQELQKLICSDVFDALITNNSEELTKYCPQNISDLCFELDPANNYDLQQQQTQQQQQQPQEQEYHTTSHGRLETDGVEEKKKKCFKNTISKKDQEILNNILFNRNYLHKTNNMHLRKIFSTYDAMCLQQQEQSQQVHRDKLEKATNLISELYKEYSERNALGETVMHEIIASDDNMSLFIKMLHILKSLQLINLLNDQLNVHGESVLHAAVWNNRAHYIRPLLLVGCNANIQNDVGNTALHVAVMEQYPQCIEYLLLKPHKLQNYKLIKVNLRNDEGLTALHIAIRLNNLEAMQKLLTYDAEAAAICNAKDGNNILHMAALQQNIQMLELLLKWIKNKSHKEQQSLLFVTNGSGKRAIDLCKQYAMTVGGKLLLNFNNIMHEIVPSLACVPTTTIHQNNEPDTAGAEPEVTQEENSFKDLKVLLQDSKKFHKLYTLLNEDDKWKCLAQKCHLKHLICLWNNAEDMLTYLCSIADTLDYNHFTKALAEVDADVLEVLHIK